MELTGILVQDSQGQHTINILLDAVGIVSTAIEVNDLERTKT